MKKYIFILLLAVGCGPKPESKDTTTSPSSEQPQVSGQEEKQLTDMMRDLLKNKFKVAYAEKIKGSSLTFTSTDNKDDITSSATCRKRGKLLIITIDTTDGMEMTSNQNTSIFIFENNEWRPLLEEMIDGVPDTLIDLNGDGKEELIMYDRKSGSAGADIHHDLYVLTSGDKYVKAETFTSFQEGYSWMGYVDGAKQRNGKVTYLSSAGGVVIHMDVHSVWAQGQEKVEMGEEDTSYSLAWNGTKLVETLNDKSFLTIHGKEIWIRDRPITGKVVMKLNEGDECKILEKGKAQTIRGAADFWYKIEFKGKQGWVFGSQTSVRQKP